MRRREFLMGSGCFAAAGLLLGGVPAWSAPAYLDLQRLYTDPTLPGGGFSPSLLTQVGQKVRVTGFVNPHLQPDAGFHVVSARPLAGCPHCMAGDLPPDSVVAYTHDSLASLGRLPDGPVTVEGLLELGSRTDPRSGFVSTVRLNRAEVFAQPSILDRLR